MKPHIFSTVAENDIFYNSSDKCVYVVNSPYSIWTNAYALTRITTPSDTEFHYPAPSITGIVDKIYDSASAAAGSEGAQPASYAGEYILFQDGSARVATQVMGEKGQWNNNTWSTTVSWGDNKDNLFLVKEDCKIYRATGTGYEVYDKQLFDNDIFFDQATKSLYIYHQASNSIKKITASETDNTLYSPLPPVTDIVEGYYLTETEAPAATAAGIKILWGKGKIDTSTKAMTEATQWSNGSYRANTNAPQGDIYVSKSDHKVYISQGTSYYFAQGRELRNGEMFLNKADNYIYLYDAASNNFIRINDPNDRIPQTETHTVTANEVTAKNFTLSNSVATGQETNILCFVNGLAQAAGVAFAVSDNVLSWQNMTLDGTITEGDIVIVQYICHNAVYDTI